MSTKRTLKLSSMLDMLFHFQDFRYTHYSDMYVHVTLVGTQVCIPSPLFPARS